ncbi:hypothetical protein BH10PAT2_BH10PAT2_1150 [soil metagenome]
MSLSSEVSAYLEKEEATSKQLKEKIYPDLLAWLKYVENAGRDRYILPDFVVHMISQKMNILQEGFDLPYPDLNVTTNPQDLFDRPHPALWDNKTATEFYRRISKIIGFGCPCSVSAIFEFLSEEALGSR